MDKFECNKANDPQTDDLLIQIINERIQQEFSNLSADELKSNVLAATSVLFAVLAISSNLKIFLLDYNFTILYIGYFGSLAILITSFILAIYVIQPKKDKWDLWDPESSVKAYYAMDDLTEIKRLIRNELVVIFDDIQTSREKYGGHLRLGYSLLVIGSIIMLITLISVQYFVTPIA